MKRQKGLILVGGARRNVGKTTMVCKLIEHFAKTESIVGLKFKTIYDGDTYFHGKESKQLFSEYLLTEEFNLDSVEDTGKMLRAGAQRAFLLRSKNEYLTEAFSFFLSKLQITDLIVCESNSLRKIIEPDLYLFIKDNLDPNMKPSAVELEKFASRVVYTNGVEHDLEVQQLQIVNKEWLIFKGLA